MTTTDQDAQRRILNRLRRARGQLDAVIAAAESGKSCRDVVTQLAAVSSALDRAGFAIIASAMKNCLADTDAEDEAAAGAGAIDAAGAPPSRTDRLTVAELEKLFLTLA